MSVLDVVARSVECDACHMVFRFPCHLRAHKCQNMDTKIFECSVCDRNYSSLTALGYHKRTKHGNRSFTCNICYESFKDQRDMAVHKIVHQALHKSARAENLFKCGVCDKFFRCRIGRDQHYLMHQNRRRRRQLQKLRHKRSKRKGGATTPFGEEPMAGNSNSPKAVFMLLPGDAADIEPIPPRAAEEVVRVAEPVISEVWPKVVLPRLLRHTKSKFEGVATTTGSEEPAAGRSDSGSPEAVLALLPAGAADSEPIPLKKVGEVVRVTQPVVSDVWPKVVLSRLLNDVMVHVSHWWATENDSDS